uniref:Uncharacterized protein n=1 Tax=Arundo donax TaxID=35708 RepID=A0A0A9DFP1_ARUDO
MRGRTAAHLRLGRRPRQHVPVRKGRRRSWRRGRHVGRGARKLRPRRPRRGRRSRRRRRRRTRGACGIGSRSGRDSIYRGRSVHYCCRRDGRWIGCPSRSRRGGCFCLGPFRFRRGDCLGLRGVVGLRISRVGGGRRRHGWRMVGA